MKLVDFFNIYFLSIFALAILSFFLLLEYSKNRRYPKIADNFFFLLGILFYVFFFGLRSENIGTDTPAYLRDFDVLSNFTKFEYALNFSKINRDNFFVLFTFLSSQVISREAYLWLLAAIYIGTIYFIIKKLTSKGRLFFLFSFLCFGFFYSMGINILRNGISGMLCLLGVLYLLQIGRKTDNFISRNIKGFTLLLVGSMFHSSGLIFLLTFLVVRFVKIKIIWYYLGTLVFYVLAFFKFSVLNLPIIGPIVQANERMEAYISGEASQEPSGFTIYVIVFQTIGLIYGAYFVWKYKDEEYAIVNKIYLVLSCVYLLFLQVSFSDRFGVFSWIWLPLILCFPFFYRDKVLIKKDFFKYLVVSFFYLFLTYYRLELD
ncbi:EpsG family protein [Psychroflexus halocasei]|uniref:EpsG family protein n=1 Tax=Psychroflexus halocasei TaxID=908615 RepID=A0A1H4DA28_9FLAO|nr:EpsG family protein [Psychroflexus halocasei]SEA69310.1 EpsG family protein [Psychroflexus halocasei]